MSTLLVTGGAGFVGTNFVRLAAGEGDGRVLDLVRLVCTTVDELLGHGPGTCERPIEHVVAGKAHAALGWHPRRTFAESMPQVVSWYLEHREWARGARAADSPS